DPPITDKVTFYINKGDNYLGRLHLGLFGTVVPKSVENFVELSKGTYGFGYNNTIFHRIIKDFMVQAGNFDLNQNNNDGGSGGHSIFNNYSTFNDENFQIKFTKPGYIAYANSGKNSNGSQFFITTVKTDWLNDHHVIFGKVIGLKSFRILDKIQKIETNSNDFPLT
ncbi:uncharacterized protein ASCRUDRAFT_25790, partial [Ascoidea rubescens DSM 1968]